MALPGSHGFILYTADMYYQKLIKEAIAFRDLHPENIREYSPGSVFKNGAEWMYEMLIKIGFPEKMSFNKEVRFNHYGFIKYSICFTVFVLSFVGFLFIHPLLIPLSVLVFYFAEVHFLFMFPLLVSQVKNPVRECVRLTYRIGILKTVLNVMPISFYMLIGLFNLKDPLRNWYIGCLSILIWYKNETGNRI